MKVEDLMIEDWLLYKSDSLENAFPIQITREMFNKELVVWKDRFEPIALTPEILEKNGFKKPENNCNYIIHNTLIFNDFTLALCTYDYNSITPYNHICYCRYVHELQHVLKLCGINKKIIV